MISTKNKLFSKYQPNHKKNKSSSYEKYTHRSDYSSAIYQTGRNSLCSGTPKIQDKPIINQKYQTYMQFISNGKIMPQINTKLNSHIIRKKGVITPNPKRISPNIITHIKRKSASDKINQPLKSKDKQTPNSTKVTFQNHLNFQIKGKLIKQNKKLEKIDFKVNQKQKQKKNKQKKTFIQQKQTINKQQQKLVTKLFKGIQFYRDLGRGAHALVRSAVDWNRKRKIAVKIYEKQQINEEQLASIQRQIEILLSLNHINIVKLYEIIQTYKTINLMMEYGGGNSLQQYIKSRQDARLTENQAKQIFKQVLKAVDFMHKNNIAHRDLKAQNILLNKHLELKIIDFGFSLRCFPEKTISTYCGTPTYMAPEVVNKIPHNPILSDRWSLGILLYSMLNGQCPFRASTQKELFKKISDGIFTYIAAISNEGKQLIQKFLKKNPKERCSASEGLLSEWFNV